MTTDLSENPPALLSLTPGDRLAALREHVGQSIAAMTRAAEILAAMEQAGDDLSAIPHHLLRMLRGIYSGVLLPEVAIRLGGRFRQKVAALPLPEQRRFVEPGACVLVVARDGSEIELEAARLSPAQVGQVFGEGFVRTASEQRAIISAEAQESSRKRGPKKLSLEIDREAGTARINGKLLSKKQLLEILAQL